MSALISALFIVGCIVGSAIPLLGFRLLLAAAVLTLLTDVSRKFFDSRNRTN